MARVTIEDCLENVESRFALVQLAVRRVLQLRRGASQLVEAPKNKEVVLALREIAANRVKPENIRQLEDMEALPRQPSVEAEKSIHREVEELMEAETQFGISLEYGEAKGDEERDLGGEAGVGDTGVEE